MIEQQGQVVAVSGGRARVRLGGRSGCTACDAGKGCGAGVFGRLLQRRPVVLEIDNVLKALDGQAVMIGLPESLFLRLAARFYLYPLLAGMAGAVTGQVLAQSIRAGPIGSDALTLLGALLCGGLVFRYFRSPATEFPAEKLVHLLRVLDVNSNEYGTKRKICE